jgi:hypothetical protein
LIVRRHDLNRAEMIEVDCKMSKMVRESVVWFDGSKMLPPRRWFYLANPTVGRHEVLGHRGIWCNPKSNRGRETQLGPYDPRLCFDVIPDRYLSGPEEDLRSDLTFARGMRKFLYLIDSNRRKLAADSLETPTTATLGSSSGSRCAVRGANSTHEPVVMSIQAGARPESSFPR